MGLAQPNLPGDRSLYLDAGELNLQVLANLVRQILYRRREN